MLPINAFIDRPLMFLVDFGLSRDQVIAVLRLKAAKVNCLKAHNSAILQCLNCADLNDFVEFYHYEIRKTSKDLMFNLVY